MRHTTLTGIFFELELDTPPVLHDALALLLSGIDGTAALLRAVSSGEVVTPAQAFSGVAEANQHLFDGLTPNGEARAVRLLNRYPDHDYFEIETPQGVIPIKAIEFKGELRIKQSQLPIVYTGEYRDTKTGEVISQVVTYAPSSVMGKMFAMELHKLASTGQTHVTLRRVPNDA